MSAAPPPHPIDQMCHVSRQHMLRVLKQLGCTKLNELSDEKLTSGVLCDLYKQYKVKMNKNKLPKEITGLKEAFHHAFATTHLEFLKHISDTFQSCGDLDVTKPSQFIRKCIQDNLSLVEWNDEACQQQLQCLIREILSLATDRSGEADATSDVYNLPYVIGKLKQYINPIRKIGQGVYSTTFKGSYSVKTDTKTTTYPLTLVKISNRPDPTKGAGAEQAQKGALLHEVAVGYALNTIRQKTGSWFVYTYGSFFCEAEPANELVVNKTVELDKMTMVSMQQLLVYLDPNTKDYKGCLPLYEVLSTWYPAATASEYAKHMHDVLMQLACALHIAQTELKFMHYDLHGQNVLIRKLPRPTDMTLRFSEEYSVVLKDVELMPTIIDYGLSCCVKDGFTLNNHWSYVPSTSHEAQNIIAMGNGTRPYTVCPLYDLFRYLSWTWVNVFHYPTSETVPSNMPEACRRIRDVWFPFLIQTNKAHPTTKPVLRDWLVNVWSNKGIKEWQQEFFHTYPNHKVKPNEKRIDLTTIDEGERGLFTPDSHYTLVEWVKDVVKRTEGVSVVDHVDVYAGLRWV